MTLERGFAATANGSKQRVALLAKYVRSVAKVVRDAADAIHHAHGAGIFHRDLKPSNVMVDSGEHYWVLDFGLASYHPPREPATTAADLAPEPVAPPSGVNGTPRYMAPEQFEGRADPRTDVWGLGMTLYELLTLRAAFGGDGTDLNTLRERIRATDPTAIEELAEGVPADIAAICRKAIAKRPDGRYQSAAELAADFDRWLIGEPTKARPARFARRAWLWSRRNKGWAAAIAFAVVAVTAFGGPGAFVGLMQRRESLIEHLVRIWLTPHAAGWSDDAWDLVRRAASIRRDDRLQSQTTGYLAGLDARQIKQFPDAAVALSFDRDGQRLLMGGNGTGIVLWDHTTDGTERQDQDLIDPFALRPDGTPLQLGPTKGEKSNPVVFPLRLWNTTTQRVDRTFSDPTDGGSKHLRAWSISPDAARVGAAVERSDGKRVLVVWDAETGSVLKSILYPASDLTFAPDHSLLAGWDEVGHIDLWSLPGGERGRDPFGGDKSRPHGRLRSQSMAARTVDLHGGPLAACHG